MVDQVPAEIRVLLADDHTLVRSGIARIVAEEPGMKVVGEVGDGSAAVEAALRLRPDVVLMDVEMPGMSGIEAARQIVEADPSLHVLMLTMYDLDDVLFEALQVGAAGYILKGAAVDELLEAVRLVSAGDAYIGPRMTTRLIRDYVSRSRSSGVEDEYETLTAREQELLPLLADEQSNEEIARLLDLSPLTVRTHRQRVMQKLNLHTKSELLKYALRRGLISLDE
jgi:two-component system response regulator NreC